MVGRRAQDVEAKDKIQLPLGILREMLAGEYDDVNLPSLQHASHWTHNGIEAETTMVKLELSVSIFTCKGQTSKLKTDKLHSKY